MPDGIASRFNAVNYTSADERLLDAVLAQPSTSLLSRAGVRPGGGLGVTMSTGPDAATVAPGGGIVTDTAGGGSFTFVIPTAVVRPLAARPAAGTSRIDVVAVVIKNDVARPSDLTREPTIQLITGVAGASPVRPAVPDGALALADLTVPSTGTVLVSKPPPRIVAIGGVLLLASAAEEAAIAPLYNGLTVFREDTGDLKVRRAGAWLVLNPAAKHRVHVQRTAIQTLANNTNTNIVWDTELRDTSDFFSPSSADLVIPVAGDYELTARFSMDNTATGTLREWITVNNVDTSSLYRGRADTPTTPIVTTGAVMLSNLAAGDVVRMRVSQTCGVNRDTYTGIHVPELTLQLVS